MFTKMWNKYYAYVNRYKEDYPHRLRAIVRGYEKAPDKHERGQYLISLIKRAKRGDKVMVAFLAASELCLDRNYATMFFPSKERFEQRLRDGMGGIPAFQVVGGKAEVRKLGRLFYDTAIREIEKRNCDKW